MYAKTRVRILGGFGLTKNLINLNPSTPSRVIFWDNGKENGNYIRIGYMYINGLIQGYIGTMEKNMETTILHPGGYP